MANKKITDLQLRANVNDNVNFVIDDGVQSYRVTPQQIFEYLRPKFSPQAFEISNLQLVATVANSALTIALKTNAGTDPSATDKIRACFRSSTITSGAFVLREISAALSMVVSSGSTLGQVSGQPSIIYVYLIDNAGTPELAVSHKYFLEDELVSTTAEGQAGSADSAIVMYSSIARSNVSCRLIGYLINTQVTSGTWATAPSKIQLATVERLKNPTTTTIASGSGTYYVPAGCKRIRVRMCGGGGGGGGSGSGSPTNGGDGGDTTFGTNLLIAGKGLGGVRGGGGGNGGQGGTVTLNGLTKVFSCSGGQGGSGNAASVTYLLGGRGASSFLGGGGTAITATAGSGSAVAGSGGGGGSASSVAVNTGGGGGSGAYIDCLIDDTDSIWSSSFAYSVGAAGIAGSAGTNGNNGGAGTIGFIQIEEYYQ